MITQSLTHFLNVHGEPFASAHAVQGGEPQTHGVVLAHTCLEHWCNALSFEVALPSMIHALSVVRRQRMIPAGKHLFAEDLMVYEVRAEARDGLWMRCRRYDPACEQYEAVFAGSPVAFLKAYENIAQPKAA